MLENLQLMNRSRNRNPRRFLNLSNVPLTQEEMDILKLGLSFTPTPKQNIAELENNIFQFIRK